MVLLRAGTLLLLYCSSVLFCIISSVLGGFLICQTIRSEHVNTCAREVAHTVLLVACVDNVPCRDFLHPWYAR